MHMYLRLLGISCDCRWFRNITGNFNYSVVKLPFFKFTFEWFSVPWDWGILLLRLPFTQIVLIIFNHSSILYHCPSPWPLVCLSWNIVRNATHLYKPEVVWCETFTFSHSSGHLMTFFLIYYSDCAVQTFHSFAHLLSLPPLFSLHFSLPLS